MATKMSVGSSKRQDLQGPAMKIFAFCNAEADFFARRLGNKSLFKFKTPQCVKSVKREINI